MDLEGMKVLGGYMEVYRVVGTVESSMTRFDGEWMHLVTLDTPKEIDGRLLTRIVLEDNEILETN